MLWRKFPANLRNARAIAVLVLAVLATPTAQARIFNLLHGFTNVPDGGNPGPLIQDAQGNLYGTTIWGGASCAGGGYTCGTVFKVDSAGNETVLYRFGGHEDGANPVAAVVRDSAGNLYGTTVGNGSIPAVSTIFKVDPNGQETVLYRFKGGTDGCCADSPLVLGGTGSLYGTSPYGGNIGCGPHGLGCGTLYKLNTQGTFRAIHTFTGSDGIQPEGGLVGDANGNLYGTTLLGGDFKCPSFYGYGCGTVFKLGKNGEESVLYTFTGEADGSMPLGVIQDSSGNLYGISSLAGDFACAAPSGCGTIFKVDSSGKFTVLYTFTPTDIGTPYYASHLVRDSKGNLYGAASFDGFLFRLNSRGNFKNIYTFPSGGSPDGSQPDGLIRDSGGTFYGSMSVSGPPDCGPSGSGEGCGTVFQLTP